MKNHESRPARGSILGESGDEHSTADAVRSMFSAVAPRYDFLNHFLSLGTDILWRGAAARSMQSILQRPGSVVADLCCGTGDLALELSRHSAGTVVGTDFCHPMLVRARAKGSSAPNVHFAEADSLRLPFADASLDGVTIAFGFRNLANYQKGLEEMLRVLRPHGRAAILEFSRVHWPVLGPAFRFYFRQVLPLIGRWISSVPGAYQYLPESVARFPDQESLAAALRSTGFTKVGYRNFTGGAAALHFGEKL
jgi:demethylmenaquinone methyltransferase / 2-methoxy-6-polyprenyl-1,4-benzoquinol methylase